MNASQPNPVAHLSVAVIGGGQAGLSISWYLKRSGIDHAVFEKKRAGRSSFAKVYEVGATRKGVAFAAGDATPECIVSGGKGTMTVTFKGQTYYVCCSGCREAFQDNPEKYIKEFNEKKAELLD